MQFNLTRKDYAEKIRLALEDAAYDVYDLFTLRTFLMLKMLVYSGASTASMGLIRKVHVTPKDIKILTHKKAHYTSRGHRILCPIPIELFPSSFYRELWIFMYQWKYKYGYSKFVFPRILQKKTSSYLKARGVRFNRVRSYVLCQWMKLIPEHYSWDDFALWNGFSPATIKTIKSHYENRFSRQINNLD